MLATRRGASTWLAGAAVVVLAAGLAAPVLEFHPIGRPDVGIEVALANAPSLWNGVILLGTGFPTLAALGLATTAVARMGRPGTRVMLLVAAGLVQLDVGLLRTAAWDVLGTGTGVAATRFGLVLLGASAGLLLVAAATTKAQPAGDERETGWKAPAPRVSKAARPPGWLRAVRARLARRREPEWF